MIGNPQIFVRFGYNRQRFGLTIHQTKQTTTSNVVSLATTKKKKLVNKSVPTWNNATCTNKSDTSTLIAHRASSCVN